MVGILDELREPVGPVLLALETQHTEDGSIDGARVTEIEVAQSRVPFPSALGEIGSADLQRSFEGLLP